MGMLTMSAALRKAIDASGQTRYQIAKATGVNQSTLSRFMGGAALSSDNADRLCTHLGLELAPRKRKPTQKKR